MELGAVQLVSRDQTYQTLRRFKALPGSQVKQQPQPERQLQRGVAAFGAALAVQFSRGSRLARRAEASTSTSGRRIQIENNFQISRELPGGSMESMDEFMRENAAQVCLQGLQRIETKPEDPEVLLCYLEPTDMGPYRTQMRMEVKIAVSPAKCDVQILDMLAGSVDKKTNEVTFDPANKVYSEADNVVSWRDNGKGGLDMLNSSWSKSEVALPWWFPLPDAFMSKTATFVIGQIVKDGMKKANEKIAVSYAEELASVKA